MADASADACPWCGEPDLQSGPKCLRCGGSLLVDLVLKDQVADQRTRFEAARALAALGTPAPSFSSARELFGSPGLVLVGRVSRNFARRGIAALEDVGVAAEERPWSETVARSAPRARLAFALLVCAGVGGATLVWRARSVDHGTELPSGSEAPPALHAAVGAAPAALTPADAPQFSATAVGQKTLPTVAAVHCRDHRGAGFFVEKELLLTNAHVACPEGETMEVELRDGRHLLGVTRWRDEWLDLARVQVLGANAPALVVGDSTALLPGETILIIGSPKGLDFTLHEGKVSFVGRSYLGVGYIQLNASVNPGNSGGPVLNGNGEVVGIVSLKVTDSDGIGLALPIEYAVPQSVAGPSPRTQRWKEMLARVEADNKRELGKTAVVAHEPELVKVRTDNLGVIAVVVERWPDIPHGIVSRFDLEREGTVSCSVQTSITSWTALDTTKATGEEARMLTWLMKYRGWNELYLGIGLLDASDCRSLDRLPSAELVLREGRIEHGRVPVDRNALNILAATAERVHRQQIVITPQPAARGGPARP